MAEFYLRPDLAVDDLAAVGAASPLLSWAAGIAGGTAVEHIYRDKEGRRTVRFTRGGRAFFLKLHRGVGWAEIFKNLCQARWPVLGAGNEYRAVLALQRLGVDTLSVAAYAQRGCNPAARQSLLVTDELNDTISLEDYCAPWASAPPDPVVRLRLVRKLADSARRMHVAGINHRDFYLCHFHLDLHTLQAGDPRCYLIDLHRAQMRHRIPRRWRVKDLAGLYFSAMDCGVTRRDLLRFMHHYNEGGLRRALGADASLWRRVEQTAQRLYRKGNREATAAAPGAQLGR